MEDLREIRLLFVPGKVLDYSPDAAPDILPIWLNGREIGKAIYDDYHYCFYIPARLGRPLDAGVAEFRFVYFHQVSGESFDPRPGSTLTRIQIDKTARPSPPDPDNILEL